jgi:hypothetical protein
MAARRSLVFVLAGVFALPSALWGATYRTTNFVVDAPTPQIAQQIGQAAERYRKEKAILWLGKEMPTWGRPLPVEVTITMGGAGGATSFAFNNGGIEHQEMHIEGPLDRLLASVLPHEITHTVFAYHFRCPVPRWADEGCAVLSEDDVEKNRHDQIVRQILNSGQAIPLRRLLVLKEYPREVMALYAQGFSVSNLLVDRGGRPEFLNFVADGMRRGWDAALQTHYQIRNVEELEQTWLTHLRNTRRQPTLLAGTKSPARTDGSRQVVVRQTIPPAQPLADAPSAVYRGVAPEQDREGAVRPASRPGYLPEYVPAARPKPSAEGWQPVAPQAPPPAPVILGAPQFEQPITPVQFGRPIPGPASPVGYPQ